MKIYTKKGDAGETRIFGGDIVSKDSIRIDTLGSIDELNSSLGIVLSMMNESAKSDFKNLATSIYREQNNLFRLGSDIASPSHLDEKFELKLNRMKDNDVKVLEEEIDRFTEKLSPLTYFILPGGTILSANIHHTRTICRRAERLTVKLAKEESINSYCIKYLNRLSDWLFTLARLTNKIEGIEDVAWKA